MSRRVDCVDRQPQLEDVRVQRRLLDRGGQVVTARHADDDRGAGLAHLFPRRDARAFAGQAQDVDATSEVDHLRNPVAADVHRVEPLERRDRDPRGIRERVGDAVEPVGQLRQQCVGSLERVGGYSERAYVDQDLAERRRIEREDLRLGFDLLGDRADVVDRHGADGAQRLRDDQVGQRVLEGKLVELVDGAPLAGQLAHSAVDLRGRKPFRNNAARQMRQLLRLRWIIALVSYADKRAPHSQRKDDLRGAWKQRADPHAIHPRRNHEDRNHEEWIRGCQSWSIGLRRPPVEQYSSKCDDTGRNAGFPHGQFSCIVCSPEGASWSAAVAILAAKGWLKRGLNDEI